MFESKSQGDFSRVILHCDLNNFFASVAMKLHPELRGKYIAVCGNPSLRRPTTICVIVCTLMS